MKNLSRRDFMKGSGAAVAATALSPTLKAAEFAGTNIEKTLTPTLFGPVYAKVVDGKFVEATPYEKDPHPNPAIAAWPDRVYSETRVRYPYVRESFLKYGHKSDTSKRGKEKFVRVSWQKAFELVASELKRVQKSYGPEAIYGGQTGWASTGTLHHHYSVHKRLLNLTGGFVDKKGNYSYGAFSAIMPRVAGSTETLHKATPWINIVKNADTIIFWGTDPYVTNNISTPCPTHQFYKNMDILEEEKKKRKINIININPVYTETAHKTGAKHISIIPNTDVAMMLAMINYLYKNNMYDKKFMKKYTVGSKKFFKYVVGESDGIDKTPEWAEKITSVPAKTIIDLAKLVVSGKTTFTAGWSMQRADHGEQPHWLMLTLSAMTGQIGQPGGGVNFGGNATEYGNPTSNAPGLARLTKKFGDDVKAKMPWVNRKIDPLPCASIVRALNNPGVKFNFNGKEQTYPDIKMIYWSGGNVFGHHQNVNELIEAWKKPETVIYTEIYWTAAAKMSDIVLPACTPFERNDIAAWGKEKLEFIAVKKVIDPVGESKSDYDICSGVAKALGEDYYQAYTEGRDEMAWVKKIYKDAREQAQKKGTKMPSFEDFWAKGNHVFDVAKAGEDRVIMEGFVKDRRKNRLGTPSGKIEVFSKTIDKLGYKECAGHPTWYEPAEWLGSPKAQKYPFHILSPHPKFRVHSQMNNTWFRGVHETAGRNEILINSKDAKKKGIKNGDVVKVFNDRGATLAGAVVTDTIRENVVMLPEGGWYSPIDFKNGNTMCAHGYANTVTMDKTTSELGNATCVNTALVDVEKYDGPLPSVTTFNPPQRV